MLGTGHFFKQTINWTVEESADPSAFWKGYISNWSGDRAEIEIFAYNFYYRSGSDYAFGFDNFRIKGIDEQPSFFNGFSHITGPLSISTHAVSPSFPGIHIAPSLNVYNVKRFFSAGNGLALRGMLNFIFSPLWLFSAFFFLQAFLLWRLARRLGCKEAYFSWLPFLNDYLIVRISGKPWCLLIIMYIPILGIFASVLLWREIFHKLGLSGFFSILMLVPIVNMLVLASLIYFLDPADGRERLSHG